MTHVGVLDGLLLPNLKRELLLFDELVIPDFWHRVESTRSTSSMADIEWLLGEGLIRPFDYPAFRDEVLSKERATFDGVVRQLSGSYTLIHIAAGAASSEQERKEFRRAVDLGLGSFTLSTLRAIANEVEKAPGVRAAPVIPSFAQGTPEAVITDWRTLCKGVANIVQRADQIQAVLSADDEMQKWFDIGLVGFIDAAKKLNELEVRAPKKTDLLSVALLALPTPGPTVGLEEIRDFVADPGVQEKRQRLHRWLDGLVAGENDPRHIEDEMEDLIDGYRAHMRIAKLRHESSWLETLITVPAEIAEQLSRAKFGEAASKLFRFRHVQADVIEAELGAPGREVAFIVEARARFEPET